MADPRDILDYEGIREGDETFYIDGVTITYDETKAKGSAQVGLAVTLSADNTVALAADGDPILGKLRLVESDSKCNVMTEGVTDYAIGTGATLVRGGPIVGCLLIAAKGYVRGPAASAAEAIKARGCVRGVSTTGRWWVGL
jgi:hypothetical protein